MRRRFGPDIPETLEDACDPATMAVIVYDMQAGVLRQLPDGGTEGSAETRCSPTWRQLRRCLQAGLPVMLVLDQPRLRPAAAE